MHIDFNIKFHPVGFGLFSSGRIENFRFVYDCGSKNITNVEKSVVDEFHEVNILNLLAISHFHFDHISGIKKLLETVSKVETIVLPYYTPRERYFYILSLYNNPEDAESESWILDFLQDPTGYLLENFGDKINEVVLIESGSSEINDNENKEGTDSNEIKDDGEVYSINSDNLDDAEDVEIIKDVEGISDSRVSVKKSGKLTLCGKINIWQFIFHYPKLSEKAVKYFESMLENAGLSTVKTKEELINLQDLGNRVSNAKKHKLYNLDINNTSLMLYHSPVSMSNTRFCSISNNIDCYTGLCVKCLRNIYPCCGGFFYTGDIDLKSYFIEIDTYYRNWLNNICVFQVPHHGSIDNWDPSISIKNPGAFHVVSSKEIDPSKLHPNPDVLYEIAKYKGLFLWCNEMNLVSCYGLMEIYK